MYLCINGFLERLTIFVAIHLMPRYVMNQFFDKCRFTTIDCQFGWKEYTAVLRSDMTNIRQQAVKHAGKLLPCIWSDLYSNARQKHRMVWKLIALCIDEIMGRADG